MFACSMIKQAIMPPTCDTNLFDMKYLLSKNVKIELEVGIMMWYGYNIEDAIVISQSTAEKYRYCKSKVYKECDTTIIGVYIKQKIKIKKGQLLYKCFKPELVKTVVMVYAEEDGFVKSLSYNDKYIKIVIIKETALKVGDKMTSLHGQKGVISLILPNSEMPYYYKDNKKITLELLINPHAFPTRMTYGQIKEMGETEATVYLPTSKAIESKIMVGKCVYIALRHQVDDKFQWRQTGKINPVTKQPVEGRKVGGGLRVGQMEKELLIALDALDTIKELWSIDLIKIWRCPITGEIKPSCKCKEQIESHTFFTMCLGYLRVLGYDIKVWPDNTYEIDQDPPESPITDDPNFGDLNPLDIRIYQGKVMLPLCLRNDKIEILYKTDNDKKLTTEILSCLRSKKGIYHKLYEGHRINNCIRSVITPNPKLAINEVEVPMEVNLPMEYGLLNRQPSLNIDSIKLVKIKKSFNKTISFNPLLCKSFNADFDGDEMNIYGVNVHPTKAKPEPQKTQDYILGDLTEVTEKGLTANKEGILLMINKKSKGSQFNYEHTYNKIGNVMLEGKNIGTIENCYADGLTDEEWYLCCKAAIESIVSIALNTPITGYLSSRCNQPYL